MKTRNRNTWIALALYLTIMAVLGVITNKDKEPCLKDPTIQDIPGMEAQPHTDTTGVTVVYYK